MKKKNAGRKPASTLWAQRDAKKLPIVLSDGTRISEGQNVALGVLPDSIFTRPRTAVRGGATRKSVARKVRRDRIRANRRRNERRAAKRRASSEGSPR